MSFHFNVHAKDLASAVEAVEDEKGLPACVKQFLLQALSAMKEDQGVVMTAIGHLYQDDYNISTANIAVHPLVWVKPRHEREREKRGGDNG